MKKEITLRSLFPHLTSITFMKLPYASVVLLHCGCISLIPFIEFMNLEFGTTHQVQMC